MRTKLWMLIAAVVILALAASLLMAQGRRAGRIGQEVVPQAKLTPEQQALVNQAKELGKQIKIAGLELKLAEAKDASESEIAAKAENLYRLEGKLHALIVKHPELRRLAGGRGRHGWGRGEGGGMRGHDMGQGCPMMGQRMGRGGGGRGGGGMDRRGMGMRGQGMGRGGGRGMGGGAQMRGRQRPQQPEAAPAPDTAPSDPEPVTPPTETPAN